MQWLGSHFWPLRTPYTNPCDIIPAQLLAASKTVSTNTITPWKIDNLIEMINGSGPRKIYKMKYRLNQNPTPSRWVTPNCALIYYQWQNFLLFLEPPQPPTPLANSSVACGSASSDLQTTFFKTSEVKS
jgi:hypothetical protein